MLHSNLLIVKNVVKYEIKTLLIWFAEQTDRFSLVDLESIN